MLCAPLASDSLHLGEVTASKWRGRLVLGGSERSVQSRVLTPDVLTGSGAGLPVLPVPLATRGAALQASSEGLCSLLCFPGLSCFARVMYRCPSQVIPGTCDDGFE